MLEVNDDGNSLSPYKHVYLLPKLLPNMTKHSSCRSGVSSLDTPCAPLLVWQRPRCRKSSLTKGSDPTQIPKCIAEVEEPWILVPVQMNGRSQNSSWYG